MVWEREPWQRVVEPALVQYDSRILERWQGAIAGKRTARATRIPRLGKAFEAIEPVKRRERILQQTTPAPHGAPLPHAEFQIEDAFGANPCRNGGVELLSIRVTWPGAKSLCFEPASDL